MNDASPHNSSFFIAIAALFLVSASLALPDVFLRVGAAEPPPAEIFDDDTSQLNQPLCSESYCFTVRRTMVVNRSGAIDWVINRDNPLTTIPIGEDGREENVRIVDVAVPNGNVHLLLESGRVITRTRDGVWRPSVAEFREVRAVSGFIAFVAAAAAFSVGYLRSQRLDRALAAAGVCAAVAHLPVTLWRHSTSISLSIALVISLLCIVGAAVAGYVAAGPSLDRDDRVVIGSER